MAWAQELIREDSEAFAALLRARGLEAEARGLRRRQVPMGMHNDNSEQLGDDEFDNDGMNEMKKKNYCSIKKKKKSKKRPPFVSLIHLHFFALGAGEVKRYMWRLCESKTLAELHEIQRVDIINVLKGN